MKEIGAPPVLREDSYLNIFKDGEAVKDIDYLKGSSDTPFAYLIRG